MKAAKKIIRILVLFMTSIWGVLLGILAPIVIMNSEMEIASHHALRVWLVMAAAGYLAPCFLIMFDKAKIAAASAIAGTALMLYIHEVFAGHTYTFMYMPQIFMTILAVLYVFAVNPHYITGQVQKRKDKLNAPAPSIFDKRKD
jgi:peptidoglycan/LPS O-acetylase OafA/YrhL